MLAGVSRHTPFSKIYFLEADTSGIQGARDVTHWTYLYACGDGNQNCGHSHAAMPFGKAWASNASGAPAKLIGKYGGGTTSHYYYYMWRFGWVFYLLGLFFDVCAFGTSFLACCGRLGSGLGAMATMIAFVFVTLATSLMTATFVRARNVFHRDGRDAKLGKLAFGLAWATVALILIALALLSTGATKKSSRTQQHGDDHVGNDVGGMGGMHDNGQYGEYGHDGYNDSGKSRSWWKPGRKRDERPLSYTKAKEHSHYRSGSD